MLVNNQQKFSNFTTRTGLTELTGGNHFSTSAMDTSSLSIAVFTVTLLFCATLSCCRNSIHSVHSENDKERRRPFIRVRIQASQIGWSGSNIINNKGAPEPVPEPEAPLGEELPGLRHHNWQIWNCLRRNFPWSLPRTAIQYFRDCLHWGTLLISNLVLYSTREQAPDPDLEAGEALLSSIHHSAGETLYNLLQQAGMQAPQSWTMHELAAEIIDAQGDLCVRSF